MVPRSALYYDGVRIIESTQSEVRHDLDELIVSKIKCSTCNKSIGYVVQEKNVVTDVSEAAFFKEGKTKMHD